MSDRIEDLRRKIAHAMDVVNMDLLADPSTFAGLLGKAGLAGTQSRIGWINHAGRLWNGELQVQFDVPGDGWSSRWPEWAFESARDALLHSKRIWVISDGPPYGANLLHVLVTNRPL